MASLSIELNVEMEDGTKYDVVADQRDIARWEIQDFGLPFRESSQRMMLCMRWLGWSASRRHGKTELSWDEWDNAAVMVDSPIGEGDDENPTSLASE